jgi:CopG-like RHH_1 or ribbon-helix-helix domain, RHH_5
MVTAVTRPAASQPASSSDSSGVVNITLPKHVYDYFVEHAKADERSVAKFIARKLTALHKHETESGRQIGESSRS